MISGVILGYLINSYTTSPIIKEVEVVKEVIEYVDVPREVEVLPLLNCPKPNIPIPQKTGELMTAYLEWRNLYINCIASIAQKGG